MATHITSEREALMVLHYGDNYCEGSLSFGSISCHAQQDFMTFSLVHF
jgi:hypothetical protein